MLARALPAQTLPAQDGAAFATLRGEVVEKGSGRPIPCRLYLQDAGGKWHHARSADPAGSAVPYDKRRFERCVETHTTLSAHPFVAELPRGPVTVTVERGKEYATWTGTVDLGAVDAGGAPRPLRIELARWVDMAGLGWYSGDTHVHRAIDELPNIVLAEDINVALPLSYWVTEGYKAPSPPAPPARRPEARAIEVDATHVIWPVNTEYEIFTVGGKRHTLGAVFVLGHKSVFDAGVPPVAPVARRAREEGALLELDKHNWPWSMAIVPVMDVDLFELSNNHIWRTEFGFADFGEREAAWMGVERDERGFTERGWIQFGFENWYALLSCGFRLRPTAGTASGVHPVPLGFGRVYVEIDGDFGYEKWMRGLDAGRSFVTTGPMLFLEVGGKPPGSAIEGAAGSRQRVRARALTSRDAVRLELVVDGRARQLETGAPSRDARGALVVESAGEVVLDESGWIAARCFEDLPGGRVRFAHTAPVFIEIAGKPLRPRREQAEYLAARVRAEFARSEGTLPEAALAEYRAALEAYEDAVARAR